MKPPVPDFSGRLCVVTGAASGIGRATAVEASQRGARLVLVDINAEPLAQLAAQLGEAVVLHRALDVADYDAVRILADDVHATHGPVDVVMNIAGIATWGGVEQLSHEQWRRTVEINLMGPIHMIECFVPAIMAAERRGQIVNISSAAGLLGLPLHAPYSATKFGLRGISEVLRFDLRRRRIGVTLVCPGAVDTGLVQTVDIAGLSPEVRQASGLTDRFRRHAAPPEKVAHQILEAVTHNRFLVYTSLDIRLLHLVERVAPAAYAFGMQIANDVFQRVLRGAADRGARRLAAPAAR